MRENTVLEKSKNFAKLHIAIKEASETAYWLELLFKSDFIAEKEFESLNDDVQEILKLLTSPLNTAKKN